MKKGHSYITFIVKDKPSHPVVKALRAKYGNQLDDGQLIYASHWANDYGWSWEGSWIGYTTKSAIKNIETGKFKTFINPSNLMDNNYYGKTC